ncbi:membrane protein [Bacillus subtilis]|nr:membrane protein [Bacillus subtilis]
MVLIGIPILALCIFLVPKIANYSAELFPNIAYIKYLVFIYLYVTAIPFYFALYQAFKLLSYIDKNKAFSGLSVRALKNIKYCAVTISIFYAAGMPVFYLIAEIDDAPGIIVIGLVIIFASMVIAVFAAVLQKLLKEAIDIKSENDLTV